MLHKDYSEYAKRLTGASYILDPEDNTFMFVGKKLEYETNMIRECRGCLIFAETGFRFRDDIIEKNHVIYTDHPRLEYARMAIQFEKRTDLETQQKRFRMTEEGFYLGENVEIGEGAYIEPGVVIYHNVKIGKNAVILSNSVIRETEIGDGFYCGENTTIGSAAHAHIRDEEGTLLRIPSLGKVSIGNSVMVGANSDINRGICGTTRIDDEVRISALVQVGHETHLQKGVLIAGGTTVTGYVEVKKGSILNAGVVVKNRITIGESADIGMGAVVMRDVSDEVMVIGNPGKEIRKGIL